MAALYQKQNKRNGSVFFIVAAVCDHRKQRSWSAATGRNFETVPIAAKRLTLWRDFGWEPG
jgi:hypothetical protein